MLMLLQQLTEQQEQNVMRLEQNVAQQTQMKDQQQLFSTQLEELQVHISDLLKKRDLDDNARYLLEMTGVEGWACTGLKMLKLVISNVPRPDCKKTQYQARLSPARNGTKGLTGRGGDVEEQAVRIQREICRQLGRLTKLQVLWLGGETRDFGNLENYWVVPDGRRQEPGLPKKDPHYGENEGKDEDDEPKDDVDEDDTEEEEG
ncbi:hypothetical protein BGX24_003511 [Mortierella sp. AD032]|nr:hypothetical protein BGX24_003511 [Mortierella sp. AD032]